MDKGDLLFMLFHTTHHLYFFQPSSPISLHSANKHSFASYHILRE